MYAGDLPGWPERPLVPGKPAQFPATACDACAERAQCTKAPHGQGRSLSIREDEQFQQKLRAKIRTRRGRAALRKRTAVEHRLRTNWCTKDVAPDTRACARISVMAVGMRRSATFK